MAALTKKGREQQAAELQRLDDRAEQLQTQAGRNYKALTERQFQAEKRDRIRTAREMKDFRLDHETCASSTLRTIRPAGNTRSRRGRSKSAATPPSRP